MKDRTVAALKRKCKKLGLLTSGKKEDLVERLQARRTPAAAATQSFTTDSVTSLNGILFVPVPFGTQAQMSENARTAFQAAAQDGPLHKEDTTVTHPRRLPLLRRLEKLERKTEKLTEELRTAKEEFDRKIEELGHTTTALGMRIHQLELINSEIRPYRNRFISVYKRDFLDKTESDENDKKFIRFGNHTTVHGGNIKVDAELYSGLNPRRDPHVFSKINGVSPAKAATIDCIETISVLDKHATIVADRQYQTTPLFHDRFQDFIAALDRQGFPEDYLNTQEEPTKQFWLFWDAVGTEVTRVKE